MDFASISKLLQSDAKKYQAYAEAKEAIDSLAAKGNLVKEIDAAVTKARNELAKIESDVGNATQALAEIDEEAKLVKAMAKEEADKIIADSKAEAKRMLDDAAIEASIAKAKADAHNERGAELVKEIAQLEKKKSDLEALISKIKAV